MFKVITTGRNINYGKESQIRLLSDSFVINAIKRGWVKPKVEYIEDGRYTIRIIDILNKYKMCGK
jgi:hypothetical protein